MQSSSSPSTEPVRRVSWAEVIGGILLALFVGVFVTLGGFAAGLLVVGETKITLLGGAASVLIPLAVYAPAYLLLRRRMPDLCRGIFIGGCIVVIVGGGCNALIVGSIGTSGFH